MINTKLTALDTLRFNSNQFNLLNPFQVEGLYPKLLTSLETLPFKIPNPLLLKNLPYFFNRVPIWDDATYYQQVINPTSTWHILVEGCTVDEILLPISTADFIVLEGPLIIKAVEIEKTLSMEDDGMYTLFITQQIGGTSKRITYEFYESLFYSVYMCLSSVVIENYMAVIKDIISTQIDNTIDIKGYKIHYFSGLLSINQQPYSDPDLALMGWLMYLLFN